MIAARALLIFEVEENANELTGENRMKMRTEVVVVLLLATIAIVGFGVLGTSTAAGCGGGSSSACSHETTTQKEKQKEVQKPISLHDESLLIADSLEVLKQHFIELINLEDRDQYQAAIEAHLNMLRDLQMLVDRFAVKAEHLTSKEQSNESSNVTQNENSSHSH